MYNVHVTLAALLGAIVPQDKKVQGKRPGEEQSNNTEGSKRVNSFENRTSLRL